MAHTTMQVHARCTLGVAAVLACWLIILAVPACTAPVEVDFSGWHQEVIVGIIERFNEEHQDIKVNYIQGGSDQILTRIAGGVAPDVYRVSWAEFGTWVRQGLALDLTPALERDAAEVRPADIFPPALAAFQFEGRQYAIPHHLGGNLMYINKERLALCGLSEPQPGWDYQRDFATMARKLSVDRDLDGAIDQWGFANPNGWFFWAGIIASNGGRIIDPDTLAFEIDTQFTRDAMAYIHDLVHVLKGAPGPGQRPNAQAHWRNGDAGMVMSPGTSEWTGVDFDFTVVPNPRGTARRVMPGGAQPLIIYPGSEKTDAAWAFIKWVIRPDIQAWISNSQGLFPPARRSVIPLVKDPILRTFGSELMNQYVYTTVIHNPIVSTFNKHLDAVLRGDEPIATATAQIQHELTVSLSAALK